MTICSKTFSAKTKQTMTFLVIIMVLQKTESIYGEMEEEDCKKLIPEDYKKVHPPPNKAPGEPEPVYININVMAIDEINEAEMDFRLDTYFNQCWNDSRLNREFTSENHILDNCYKHIWLPDINFESAKKVGTLGKHTTYFYVMKDGSLYLTIRYSFRVGCLMDFRMYPFDTQNCLFLLSFMQTAKPEAILKWTNAKSFPFKDKWEPVKLSKSIEPLQFNLLNPTVHSEDIVFYIENFTRLVANFTFVRRVTGTIVNIYAPSALIVAVSWVTFWIRVEAAPARVALSITSLLTLCTQATQYKSQLPPVNYLTAMDIWLFACIVMVFSTLLEFAISYNNYTKFKSFTKKDVTLLDDRQKLTNSHQISKKTAWKSDERSAENKEPGCCTFQNVDNLDKFCQKFYPFSFITFIIIYWIYFLKAS